MIVYIYTFPNGKKYIGQTKNTLAQRAGSKGHRYKGQLVYNAIEKYGWNNIQKEIFKCKSKEEMDELEKQLILKYKTQDRNFGYNIEPGGYESKSISEETRKKLSLAHSGEKNYFYGKHYRGKDHPMFGKHHTEEAKQKMRLAHLGKTPTNAKKVICIETQKIYPSATSAAIELKLNYSGGIGRACEGRQKTAGGYHWAWLENYEKEENLK